MFSSCPELLRAAELRITRKILISGYSISRAAVYNAKKRPKGITGFSVYNLLI
jgi:hypothetical protein